MADATRLIGSDDLGGLIIQGTITIARPVGTLVRNSVDGELYASTNASVATYTKLTNASAATIIGLGFGTVNANPDTFTVTGAAVGDIVFATIQSEDGGVNKLVSVDGAVVSAPDTIQISFSGAGPTNNDGVVNWLVFDATP
jgi:hypothetical protein